MIERKLVHTEVYKTRTITVRHMGPDLLSYVGDIELPNFYWDTQAAVSAGKRYINEEIRERGGKK
jgi:hypothetical protein